MAQDPLCSTPRQSNQSTNALPLCSLTPVLQRTPRKSASKDKCFVCLDSPSGQLRKVCSNVTLPEHSETLSSIRDCFGIYTIPQSIWTFKICLRCKKLLNSSTELKSQIEAGLADKLDNKENDPPRYKRMAKDSSTPKKNPQKRRPSHSKLSRTPVKDTNSPSKRKTKQTKCMLSFGESPSSSSLSTSCSDHSYSQSDTSQELVKNASKLSALRHCNTKSASLPEEERQRVQLVLGSQSSSCKDIAKSILQNKNLKLAVETALLSEINVTCMHLCSTTFQPGPSVLRTLQLPNLLVREDILSKAVLELQNAAPFVYDIFRTVACSPDTDRPNTDSVIGTMYGIAMHNRNKDLSAVQKINTAVALRYHASNDLLAISNKCGITLAPGTKYKFLDALGKFNLDGLVKSVRGGRPGKLTVDNIDGKIRANQIRKGEGDRHYHYTASTYYPDRVDTSHLSMQVPIVPEIPLSKFYLSLPEETSLKQMYGYMVGYKPKL